MTANNRIDWHITFLSSKAKKIRPGEYLWQLPNSFSLKTNDYEIGVTALSVPTAEIAPSSKTQEHCHLLMTCDFVENEIVGDIFVGLLLSCSVDSVASKSMQRSISIEHVSYTPIIVSQLNALVLKFAYTNGDPFLFHVGEIMATLHIRRIPLSFV